jgi:hypothetical protein
MIRKPGPQTLDRFPTNLATRRIARRRKTRGTNGELRRIDPLEKRIGSSKITGLNRRGVNIQGHRCLHQSTAGFAHLKGAVKAGQSQESVGTAASFLTSNDPENWERRKVSYRLEDSPFGQDRYGS